MEGASTTELTFPRDLISKDFDAFVPKESILIKLLNLEKDGQIVINNVVYEVQRDYEQTENSFKFAPVNPTEDAPRINIHSESSLNTGGIPKKIWDIDIVQSESLETDDVTTRLNTYTADGDLYSEKRIITTNTPAQIALRHPVTNTPPYTSYTYEIRNKTKYITIGITDDYKDHDKTILAEFVITENGNLLPSNSNAEKDEVYLELAKKIVPVLSK